MLQLPLDFEIICIATHNPIENIAFNSFCLWFIGFETRSYYGFVKHSAARTLNSTPIHKLMYTLPKKAHSYRYLQFPILFSICHIAVPKLCLE